MRADAAELVIKSMQVVTQEPDDLHAEFVMIVQQLHEMVARDEGGGCLLISLGRHAVSVP